MNAKKFIAAAAIFVAAGSAFAADAPVAAAAVAPVAAGAATQVASNPVLPKVTITNTAGRTRAEVHAEAVEFVKNYKSTFATDMAHYKG